MTPEAVWLCWHLYIKTGGMVANRHVGETDCILNSRMPVTICEVSPHTPLFPLSPALAGERGTGGEGES